MAELVPSKASGQGAFHALLPSSTVSMPSIASSSTAPPTLSFCDLTMQDQEHILDDLEKSDSDRSIIMMPPLPPPAPPFDAAHQPPFAPSMPGTSISTISQSKPQSKSAEKCKSKGNDNARSLAHPAGSTKEASVSRKTVKSSCVTVPEAFQEVGGDIHDLSSNISVAVVTLQTHATHTISHSVEPVSVHQRNAINLLVKEGLQDNEVVHIIKCFM
ncbi:hypothetical protein BDR04DRAFT_1153618 [Suillus decipiens]|nr:hypothetical protein BDR04DRAFT_1153618 [Suillus decipiens]